MVVVVVVICDCKKEKGNEDRVGREGKRDYGGGGRGEGGEDGGRSWMMFPVSLKFRQAMSWKSARFLYPEQFFFYLFSFFFFFLGQMFHFSTRSIPRQSKLHLCFTLLSFCYTQEPTTQHLYFRHVVVFTLLVFQISYPLSLRVQSQYFLTETLHKARALGSLEN